MAGVTHTVIDTTTFQGPRLDTAADVEALRPWITRPVPHLPTPMTSARTGRSFRRPPVIALAAAVVCALGAWVSFGLMAVVDDARSPRVGLLPPVWVLAVAGIVLLALACWKRVPEPAWRPALFPAVLLLPWLPFRVPPVFLLWTGPVVWLVWVATLAGVTLVVLDVTADRALRVETPTRRRPSRVVQGWAVFGICLAIYGLTAAFSSELRPTGDEPHYLVITQSLLRDGDLQIENNHAGEDYAAYYSGLLKPDYLRRGRNAQIYSIHAPGLPVLVAPAFAGGGYPAVVAFLVLLSAIGAWLVWRSSLSLTDNEAAAWFGAAAVCLSVPFLCHSGAVFPDGVGAVLVMTGVAGLIRLESDRVVVDVSAGTPPGSATLLRAPRWSTWLLHGTLLAALPWLHTRFAAAAAVLGTSIALRLIQQRRLDALGAFALVPAVSASAWFGFFYAIYGTFSPAAPYRSLSDSSFANLWPGFPALLLDQQYGLVPNAPVYIVAIAGLALLVRERRRLAIELTGLMLAYLGAVASYRMWWGGWSAPARFAVPVLLALGPCAAWFWMRGRPAARAAAIAALTVSLFASLVFATVEGGRLALNSRDGVARWLEWLCPVVDLPRALPSFFWTGTRQALGDAAIWAVLLGAAWLALLRASRTVRPAQRTARLAALVAPLFGLAGMTAAAFIWKAHGVVPVTPTSGQLRLLDTFDPAWHVTGVRFRPLDLRSASDLLDRLRVSVPERRPQPPSAPAFWVRDLPAGTYRLVPLTVRNGWNDVDVVVGKSRLPLQRCRFGNPEADCLVRLPVDLVEIHATAPARTPTGLPPRRLALQPVDPLSARERPARLKAMAAANYESLNVFAFDERIFLEPSGLWVEGGFDVPIVLASMEPRKSVEVLFRNGANANTVHLRGRGLTLDLPLAAREEKVLEIPLDSRSQSAFLQVHTDRGFKPSQVDAASRDTRYLGVWLEFAAH